MAFKRVNFNAQPYNPNESGQLVGQEIFLCKPTRQSPRVVMVNIDWSKYPTGSVRLDLKGLTVAAALDMLKSVYIDNLGIGLPVVVYFSDTQSEVTCPAYSEIQQSVLTSDLSNIIIFLGSTSLTLTGTQAATTRLYFSNVDMGDLYVPQLPQAIQFWQTSNQPNTPSNYAGKPAGEMRGTWQLNLENGTMSNYLNGQFMTANTDMFKGYTLPRSLNCYIVITDIRAWLTNVIVYDNTIGGSAVKFGLQINTIPQTFVIMDWECNSYAGDLECYKFKLLQEGHGLYIPIDPFDKTIYTIVVNNVFANITGNFFLDMNFTYINRV